MKQSPKTPTQARRADDARPQRRADDAPVRVQRARGPVQWLKTLFRRSLRIERRGLQIHLLLEPVRTPEPKAAAPRPGEALRRAHLELCDLLDRHGDTRHVMPHLSFFEQALMRSGSRAAADVPLQVLIKARSQLENLIHDEASRGLDELCRHMSDAISSRQQAVASVESSSLVPDSHADSSIEVSEASHSLFDEMERSWSGEVPFADTRPNAFAAA
jgi:hypothetical protein